MSKHSLRLAAALLVALLLLLTPLAVLAASPNVEDVLARLATLQNADINPAWEPDIRANMASVQALLDAYEACSAGEKAEFTARQNADLRAYFEVLFRIEGRDAAGLDALFATAPPASSQSASSSRSAASSAPASSAPASSAPASSSPASAPAAASAPAHSAADASLPASVPAPPPDESNAQPLPGDDGSGGGAALPAAPGGGRGGGWLALFGNRGLGALLIVVLAALAVILFIRFLVALRRAGKAPDADEGELRARELFGENYEPLAGEVYAEDAPPEPLATNPAPLRPQFLLPADGGEDDAPPEPKKRNKGGLFRRLKARPAAEEPGEADEGEADTPPAGERPAEEPEASSRSGRAAAAAQAEEAPEAPLPRPRSDVGRNRDTPIGIGMRSFSNQPRTGRPGKMTFRQGDPDDLDAIDE